MRNKAQEVILSLPSAYGEEQTELRKPQHCYGDIMALLPVRRVSCIAERWSVEEELKVRTLLVLKKRKIH